MGIDSGLGLNATFVSGVFSRVAIAVSLNSFGSKFPPAFSVYHLSADPHSETKDAKLFFPQVGFPTCTAAILCLREISPSLVEAHDLLPSLVKGLSK